MTQTVEKKVGKWGETPAGMAPIVFEADISSIQL